MRTLVISDVHLGSKGSQASQLLELLKEDDFDRYILVGDIIDGWLFQRYKKFSSKHTRVIQKFLKISKKKEVIWIAGNHDEFIRKYIPLEIGNIKIVDEFIEDGIWFCHGDKYDGIIKLKWLGILGSWGYDLAIEFDRFLKKFGHKKSLSKFLKDNVKSAVKFITDFENEMMRQAEKRGCCVVVCGHIHKPEDKTNGKIRYINTGDWIENNSYLVWESGEIEVYYQKYRGAEEEKIGVLCLGSYVDEFLPPLLVNHAYESSLGLGVPLQMLQLFKDWKKSK